MKNMKGMKAGKQQLHILQVLQAAKIRNIVMKRVPGTFAQSEKSEQRGTWHDC